MSPAPELRIQRATVGDAARLTEIGAATFREAYEHNNEPSNLAAYISENFNLKTQLAQLGDQTFRTLFAYENDDLVGYAQICRSPIPDSAKDESAIELKRLYSYKKVYGRGYAQEMLTAIEQEAITMRAKSIWLGVWEENPRAIAFYKKMGFSIVGEQVFVVGTDPQRDWTMVKAIVTKPF